MTETSSAISQVVVWNSPCPIKVCYYRLFFSLIVWEMNKNNDDDYDVDDDGVILIEYAKYAYYFTLLVLKFASYLSVRSALNSRDLISLSLLAC